jgi:hypothetical protein
MRKFFIHDGNNEIGPFDIEQLKLMGIKQNTPVWYEGLQNWTTAIHVEDLKNIIIATPPKFETISSHQLPPPIVTSVNSVNNDVVIPKKKKVVRNTLIVFGIIVASFLGLMAYASANSPSSENFYDENNSNVELEDDAQLENDRINAELTLKNRKIRNNITEYVGASTNQCTYDGLGGISNLDITVTNNTDYKMNEVTVSVDYIKDNGDVFKSEIVTIYNIPAHQDKSVSAPESNRGTSVNTSIHSISSKNLHMCYYSVSTQVGEVDPYFCK